MQQALTSRLQDEDSDVPRSAQSGDSIVALANDGDSMQAGNRSILKALYFHKKALECAKRGDFAGGVSLWEKAIAINPEDYEFHYNSGLCHFELKNYDKATAAFERAIAINPAHARSYLILGTARIRQRKYKKAEAALVRSIQRDPNSALARLNLGAVYTVLREYDRAIEEFERSLELRPGDSRAHFGLGKVYSTTGKASEANLHFRQVLELGEGTKLSQIARRLITVEVPASAGFQETASDSGRRLNLPPATVRSHDVHALYSEGYQNYLGGHYQDACSRYGACVELSPDDDQAWWALGEAQLRASQLEQAASSFKRALELEPRQAKYHKSLAIAFDIQGDSRSAINAAKSSISLGLKTDAILHAIWGKNLNRTGKHSEAIVVLEQALRFDPNSLLAHFQLASAYVANEEASMAQDHARFVAEARLSTPLAELASTL